MGKTEIKKNLKTLTDRIKKQFHPKQILLFGSYASGKANDYSDVDVVVVADKFKSIPRAKRLDMLYPLTQDLYPDFHVFGFTPSEFNNAGNLTIMADIKKSAINIL